MSETMVSFLQLYMHRLHSCQVCRIMNKGWKAFFQEWQIGSYRVISV